MDLESTMPNNLTFEVSTENDNGHLYSTIYITFKYGKYKNVVTLFDCGSIKLWNKIISAINTKSKFTHSRGGNNSLCISISESEVDIDIQCSGGDANGDNDTTYDTIEFLPIAIGIRDQLILNGHHL